MMAMMFRNVKAFSSVCLTPSPRGRGGGQPLSKYSKEVRSTFSQ